MEIPIRKTNTSLTMRCCVTMVCTDTAQTQSGRTREASVFDRSRSQRLAGIVEGRRLNLVRMGSVIRRDTPIPACFTTTTATRTFSHTSHTHTHTHFTYTQTQSGLMPACDWRLNVCSHTPNHLIDRFQPHDRLTYNFVIQFSCQQPSFVVPL